MPGVKTRVVGMELLHRMLKLKKKKSKNNKIKLKKKGKTGMCLV